MWCGQLLVEGQKEEHNRVASLIAVLVDKGRHMVASTRTGDGDSEIHSGFILGQR